MSRDIPTRPVGSTGLELTELSYGAASLGNMFRTTTDEEATAAVAAAWDGGIRYFDTAPHYGLGLSERRLGAALSAYPREELVISTKVGRLLVPRVPPAERDDNIFEVPGDVRREWDFSRDGILRSVEDSLNRIGTDYLDILYLHDPDISGVENAARDGAAALIELREQGVVRAVGIGCNSTGPVAELFATTDIDIAMLAGRYTLLEQRGADAVFEAAAGRAIVAVGVFNSGLLATDRPQPGATWNYEEAPAELVERAGVLADACERHGVTLPQAAIAFPLRHPAITSVAIGMRSPSHVARNLELYHSAPPASLWDELSL